MRHFMDTVFTRRELLRLGGVTMAGYYFLPLVQPKVKAARRVEPRGSARFCIFVMLTGGPSHVDWFDLKEGPWTPKDFGVRQVGPGIKWPCSLYGRLAKRLDKVAIVRSVEAWDSVHGRAQYYVQAAHPLNLALAREIPPIGAVVGLEYWSRRRQTDSFPPYVALNTFESQCGLLGSGFLPATFAPFHVNTASDLSAFSPNADEREILKHRWEFLLKFDERLRTDKSLAAKAYRDFHNFYEAAVSLMSDPRAAQVFNILPEDKKRYGNSITGDAFILARNLIEVDAGTHFIFISQNGWDHHASIYDEKNFYRLTRELDAALSSLIDDLSSRKRKDGTTLLDETLIVVMGEFGRTPGPLTRNKGRDHYQYANTVLFAGGVKGGKVIGKTDEVGAKIVDPGWSGKCSIYMEDIATTIYSALGIDWTKTIEATPSGRTFYYVEPFSATKYVMNSEISDLFV